MSKFKTPNRSPGRRRQDKFLDLYSKIAGDVNIPTMLVNIAKIVSAEMRSQSTTVYMVQPETEELHSVNSFGNVLQMIKLPIRKDSLAGYCALTRRSFIVSDAYGDLSSIDPEIRFDGSWDQKLNFRTKDVVCVPALYGDVIQGVIQVINSIDRPFEEDAIAPLQCLAKMVGYAIYNARLYDELHTLKEVEKRKAEFMRIMIHELKSPVANVKTMLDALKYVPSGDPREENFHTRINGNMDKLLVLIQDVLNLSKIKSGLPMGEITTVDFGQELKAIVEDYRQQIDVKGLSLRMFISQDGLNVRIDRTGLALVVSNLVSNAIKYTEKGKVGVRLTSEDHFAVLEVEDSGIGIPADDQKSLFREFFRASNAKKSRVNGTGVGLSGIKDLIERFGGNIDFRSEENVGSVFTVKLPLYSAESRFVEKHA
jgi:signal transduction histidine kinase